MLPSFLHEPDKPGNHILHKRHVAATFTCCAFGMTKIILHVDNNQHAMLRVDPLCKTKSQNLSPNRKVFL
jgi:hypothetical protein